MTDFIEDEVFVVAMKRRDGRQPKAVTVAGSELFHTVEDANNSLKQMPAEVRSSYEVFRAVLRIEEAMPLLSMPTHATDTGVNALSDATYLSRARATLSDGNRRAKAAAIAAGATLHPRVAALKTAKQAG